MLISLSIVLIAFIWLLRESDYLRIQLPAYQVKVLKSPETSVIVKVDTSVLPEVLMPVKNEPLLLAAVCNRTRIKSELSKSKYRYTYNNYPIAYQSMIIGTHTVTLNSSLPNLYDLIAEFQKAQNDKLRKPTITLAPFQSNFIEQVRTGSHRQQYGMRGGKKYYQAVDDYETVYRDCLPGSDWLKAHEHDVIPEPTIDITVNDTELHVNGNYKKGLIKEFMKQAKQIRLVTATN